MFPRRHEEFARPTNNWPEETAMPREDRTIRVPLTMRVVSTSPHAVDRGRCLACEGCLDLQQPDAEDPDRLLGICEVCRLWYVIDLVPGTDDAVMLQLPRGDYVRDEMAERATEKLFTDSSPEGNRESLPLGVIRPGARQTGWASHIYLARPDGEAIC
jgi:hypothetical protein